MNIPAAGIAAGEEAYGKLTAAGALRFSPEYRLEQARQRVEDVRFAVEMSRRFGPQAAEKLATARELERRKIELEAAFMPASTTWGNIRRVIVESIIEGGNALIETIFGLNRQEGRRKADEDNRKKKKDDAAMLWRELFTPPPIPPEIAKDLEIA